MTRDFFDELRNFNASRGIGAGLELRNRFHQALNLKRLSPTVLALSDRDFEEFRRRVYNVLERVDSIGFMTHILEREWEDSWAFVRRVYAPGGGFVGGEDTDLLTGTHDFQTARYAMETLVSFSVSLCEYLARAAGFVFRKGNIRRLAGLREYLRRSSFPEAGNLLAVLDARESLWRELQEEGFRDRLRNVDSGSPTWDNKTLRDVAAHYWALRVNPLQFTIDRRGAVVTHEIIEPRAAVHHRTPFSVEWGEGKGILVACVALRDEDKSLVADTLGVFLVEA